MARLLETDTFTNKNIATAVSIGSYTATSTRLVHVRVAVDQVAGNGDYVIYATLQIAGSGSAYVIIPKTTAAAASGETALMFVSGPIPMDNADVLTIYIDGLAGDTTTPDTRVDFYEQDYLRPTVSGRTLDVAATGEAGLDFTNRLDTIGILPAVAAGAASGLALVGSAMALADDAITAAKFDESTAYPLKAADAGSTYIARTGADADTLETLSDQLDGVEPADVWAYSSRTLTATPALTTDGTTAGAITRRRGDSWSISLTIGAITGYTSLWITVKAETSDADTAAILQVKKNASGSGDGLLYVNGAAASDATKGSITVSDASTGAIVIALDETITDDMTPGSYSYDVQALISGAVSTPDSGTFTVTADVTRVVS